MSETAKQVWAVISGAIGLGIAAGAAYGIYNDMFLLPPYIYIAYNLIYAGIAFVLIFAAVFAVLYKGMHPY